jgi:hypothetical protein
MAVGKRFKDNDCCIATERQNQQNHKPDEDELLRARKVRRLVELPLSTSPFSLRKGLTAWSIDNRRRQLLIRIKVIRGPYASDHKSKDEEDGKDDGRIVLDEVKSISRY